MSISPIPIILGAGSIGQGITSKCSTLEALDPILSLFSSFHGRAIDTSSHYTVALPGTSELLLGEAKCAAAFEIDTKLLSFRPGSHKKENIQKCLRESLKSLGMEGKKIRVLYLHGPDRTTPFEEILETINEEFQAGSFEKFGLSNFTAKDIEAFVQISKKNNWIQPSVYQGQYNVLARRPEAELFPILRKYGIAFFAYSPTAGGFLSGTYTKDGKADENSRYGTPVPATQMIRIWYFRDEMFDAVSELQEHIDIDGKELAMRWMVFHSGLDPNLGDSVVISGGQLNYVQQTYEWIGKGPLDERVLKLIEDLWEKVKEVAPPVDL